MKHTIESLADYPSTSKEIKDAILFEIPISDTHYLQMLSLEYGFIQTRTTERYSIIIDFNFEAHWGKKVTAIRFDYNLRGWKDRAKIMKKVMNFLKIEYVEDYYTNTITDDVRKLPESREEIANA